MTQKVYAVNENGQPIGVLDIAQLSEQFGLDPQALLSPLQKTVYLTDEAGKYIGSRELDASDLSPLEVGEFLVPGGAYEDAPPQAFPGQTITRTETGWQLDPVQIAELDANTYEVRKIINGLVNVPADTDQVLYRFADDAEVGGHYDPQTETYAPAPPPLEQVQERKWFEMKMARDAAIDNGAPTPKGVVDSDQLSRSNITGAVVGAQLALAQGGEAAANYSVTWTMKDNSAVPHNATEMCVMGAAVLAHVNNQHAIARSLRAQIYATNATRESVAAVTWP